MGTLHPAARDLERSAPFQFQRADEAGESDGRTLSGYAAVFGQDTEIDSWEGTFTETIRKGAFRKTIRESKPVMQFDHGHHPLIGSIPIGSIEDLREDDDGLYVEARLSENWLIEPVREAIAQQTVTGMSFRFEVVRDEWRDQTGKLVKPEELMDLLWYPGDRGPLRRELIELKCRELGPVVFPAYAGTSVSVRSRGMAAELVRSDDMTRQIRQSLARDAASLPQVPEDPELRREVAAALLFSRDSASQAAPPTGHPAAETTTDGAPLEREHPPAPSTTDAPPFDGHPSTPENPSSERLRGDIREIAALMKTRLAPIVKDKD
ncbi:HK97 family phage prohead protease [Streptomyces himalayensis]|uniref:HK97 family phage prohead protease n=1 Tax=Streptomyces himalayensis subsp. himalayensis TaxID=2756131 RepID=A0A7W0DW98_9ACTN|nr:HK97 family phage prohead protease [Streptomyces himalayensis]MBA2951594.1 HK97 family phage prohead protease [Streptomyces himalayensis subsp. himalayensis]